MKRIIAILICVIFLYSCSGENLYEFKDLTAEDDYIYSVYIYPKNEGQPFSYKIVHYQTNGYNEIISRTMSTSVNNRNQNELYSVKGYRQNGIKFYPEENIGKIYFLLSEVGPYDGYIGYPIFQYITDGEKSVNVGFDFQTNTRVIQEDISEGN
ncbi:hypothetical protein [Christiangramia antarctica]